MPNYFEQLEAELPAVRKLAQSSEANGFFAQEVLRFRSIAGTLLAVQGFSLNEKSTVDERYPMDHCLSCVNPGLKQRKLDKWTLIFHKISYITFASH